MENDKSNLFSSLPPAPKAAQGPAPVAQKPTRLWPAILLLVALVVGAAVVGVLQNRDKSSAAKKNIAEPTQLEVTMLKEFDKGDATASDSGLKYIDLKVGDGQAAKRGDTVQVHYTGTFPNGQKFDSSRDRNQLFSFRLGFGEVIKGWDEGVEGMKEGGLRKLIVPPHLAYGPGGNGSIPPNATLVFEVELVKVH